MGDYDVSTYGDRIADVYDQWVALPTDENEAVDFLAPLAGTGIALELGIGTGRVALPLAARGVEVHGLDASEAMVAKLRAKPGGADIPVTMGDFAEVRAEGPFSLVFSVFNTFFGLLTQEDQVRCFQEVSRKLSPEGAFVLQLFVPDPTRFIRGQRTETMQAEPDHVHIAVARHDPLEQRVRSQHVLISERGVKLYPVRLRYAWPSELDLMARLAGLRLRERWSGWKRQPFTEESTTHISVYGRE
jgi:SAM-dependent methyltransferase